MNLISFDERSQEWEKFQKLFPPLPPIGQKQTVVVFSQKDGDADEQILSDATPKFCFNSVQYVYQISGTNKMNFASNIQAVSDRSIQNRISFNLFDAIDWQSPRTITHLCTIDQFKEILDEAVISAVSIRPLAHIILSYFSSLFAPSPNAP